MVHSLQKTALSTSDVAHLFNVTETTVKRWADEGTLVCQKTPGGHRKFEIKHVVEFAEKNHLEPVGTLVLSPGDKLGERIQLAVLARDFRTLVAVFVEKATAATHSDLFLFFSYLYQHCVPLVDIFDHVLRPGLAVIGDLWARGEIGVSHEHLASNETVEALSKLNGQTRKKGSSGRAVICACLGDELHDIGLRCAGYLFESEGWETLYLGARTPPEAVTALVSERKPDLVCLSITGLWPGENIVVEHLHLITRAARAVGGRMLIGGRASRSSVPDTTSVDAVLGTIRELQAYITQCETSGDRQ